MRGGVNRRKMTEDKDLEYRNDMSEDEFLELVEIKHGLSRDGWKEPVCEKITFEELPKHLQESIIRLGL